MRKKELIRRLEETETDLKTLDDLVRGWSYGVARIPEDGLVHDVRQLRDRVSKVEDKQRSFPDYKHHITTCTIRKYDDDNKLKSEKPGWRWMATADGAPIGSGQVKTIEDAQAAVKAAVQEHFWKWLCDTTKQPTVGEPDIRSIFDPSWFTSVVAS